MCGLGSNAYFSSFHRDCKQSKLRAKWRHRICFEAGVTKLISLACALRLTHIVYLNEGKKQTNVIPPETRLAWCTGWEVGSSAVSRASNPCVWTRGSYTRTHHTHKHTLTVVVLCVVECCWGEDVFDRDQRNDISTAGQDGRWVHSAFSQVCWHKDCVTDILRPNDTPPICLLLSALLSNTMCWNAFMVPTHLKNSGHAYRFKDSRYSKTRNKGQ